MSSNSSVKNTLEESLKSTVHNLVACYTNQLSDWLRDNKEVEISPEELCVVFDVPYKSIQTPGPNGSSVQTQLPNMPNYYTGTGVTIPKKKGGRTKKITDPNLPSCSYVMARGKSAGQKCSNQVVGDGTTVGGEQYCKACLKKAAVKTLLEGSSSKATLQPPVLAGSVIEIPSEQVQKNDELQVVKIDGEESLYREMTHGFIVKSEVDGSVTAISIDDNGTRRPLSDEERKIAMKLNINVVNDGVALPTAIVPTVPEVPQIIPS